MPYRQPRLASLKHDPTRRLGVSARTQQGLRRARFASNARGCWSAPDRLVRAPTGNSARTHGRSAARLTPRNQRKSLATASHLAARARTANEYRVCRAPSPGLVRPSFSRERLDGDLIVGRELSSTMSANALTREYPPRRPGAPQRGGARFSNRHEHWGRLSWLRRKRALVFPRGRQRALTRESRHSGGLPTRGPVRSSHVGANALHSRVFAGYARSRGVVTRLSRWAKTQSNVRLLRGSAGPT